jgi:23S rRNA pseudouridine2605 synthase
MSLIRLQRFLSQAGIASRREAEKIILNGEVAINEVVVRELGVKIDPEVDRVSHRGKRLSLQKELFYYLLYKPVGVVVTKKDPEGRKTVFNLIPNLDPSVNTVGRLDLDSEGLLLLTNDGELAHRLTHPSFEIDKVYHVQLNRLPPLEKLEQLRSGIFLEDKKTAPAQIKVLHKSPGFWMSVQIHEGKKRQVRRMFEWAGCRVSRLIRVKLGPLELGNLQPGKWRMLTSSELSKLNQSVGLAFP